MSKTTSKKKSVTFADDEFEQLCILANDAGMSPTQYMKAKALDPSGDSVLRRHVAKAMSQFYTRAQTMESMEARELAKEVADQLWQYVK